MVKTQIFMGILFDLLLMGSCEDGNPTIPSNCTQDFEVTVNTTGSNVEEGDDITLTCVHNVTSVIQIKWTHNERELEGKTNNQLVLEKVRSSNRGKYVCSVISRCGTYESLPHEVTVSSDNPVIILVICGISALALIVIMGLAMKYKLRRDNAKHKERMNQRAQAGQSGTAAPPPPPFTPRES